MTYLLATEALNGHHYLTKMIISVAETKRSMLEVLLARVLKIRYLTPDMLFDAETKKAFLAI